MAEPENQIEESAEPNTKCVTAKEVAEHNKKDDIWIIIRDKVYDVTKFLDEHPGGREVLLDLAGKNATQDFIDVGHSSTADDLMKQYFIGDLIKDGEVQAIDPDNVPVAFTSCFKSLQSLKSRFGFK